MSGDFMMGDADNAIAVPFSDDEAEAKPEELLEEDTPTASIEERQKNKERRQARIARLLSEGKQSKAEVSQLKSEQAALREELAELRGRVSQATTASAAGVPPGKDRYDLALDEVYEKQTEAYNAAQAEIKAGTWSPERQRHYEKIARDVETAKSRIHTQRELDARSQSQRAEQAQQIWVQKYPEVYGDPRAYQYAEATFRRKQALLGQGEKVTNELVDEVMNETMTTFKLGKRQAPSVSEKARLSGMPSTGGGGSGGSSNSGAVTMTPQLRRIAIARYSELPEAEAIKKWANTEGKSLRAKKVL
jgi:hypothetical protein